MTAMSLRQMKRHPKHLRQLRPRLTIPKIAVMILKMSLRKLLRLLPMARRQRATMTRTRTVLRMTMAMSRWLMRPKVRILTFCS